MLKWTKCANSCTIPLKSAQMC